MSDGPSTSSTFNMNQVTIQIIKIYVNKSVINNYCQIKRITSQFKQNLFLKKIQKMYLDPSSTVQTRISHP